MAKSTTISIIQLLKDRSVTKTKKIRSMDSLVFLILLYSAETWTIKNRKKKRISAFEMWAWRRLLRISWVHHRTNDSILQEIDVEERLIQKIYRMQLAYFGHIP